MAFHYSQQNVVVKNRRSELPIKELSLYQRIFRKLFYREQHKCKVIFQFNSSYLLFKQCTMYSFIPIYIYKLNNTGIKHF